MKVSSKSRYLSGLQCHKQLWLKVHDPGAPELQVTPAQQSRFDTGHRVGIRARAEFPGGVLIDVDPRDHAPALAATKAAIASAAPAIFEASFELDGIFAAIDILERTGDGWTLLEVKATLDAKQQHLPDLAIQAHLARRSGLRIERVQVMHLNRAHRHPDIGPLFVRSDVSDEVNELVPGVAGEVSRQRAMLTGGCPEIEIGDHCGSPRPCAFMNRCWPVPPKHDVSELYKPSRKTEALRASGYETIADIPELEAKTLDAIQARQRRAVITGEVIVEPTLAAALAALAEPIAFLDFESVNLALPVWRGSAPLCAVVVQHSVHRVEASGALTHHEFLAEPGSDGREELARHLLEATAGTATVLAWHADFERDRVAELAEHVPALAGELRSLAERIVDLLPIVRENVYHPEFRGSFSLKSVGPALVPELGYADLEVADGFTASSWLAEYLVRGNEMTAEERAQLRAALLAYCGRDTEVLAGVWRVLGALARG